MLRKACLSLVILLMPVLAQAEHSACQLIPYDFSAHSSAELRHIALGCESPAFRDLNFNRALFKELQSGFALYEHLDFASGMLIRNPLQKGRSFGMYIHLAESFAPRAGGSAAYQAGVLNRVYEEANKIAELRLKGYNNRAHWLELQSWNGAVGQ